MESDSEAEKEGKLPKVRLVRKGILLVADFPGVPKMSVEETNEWIDKSRDRDI